MIIDKVVLVMYAFCTITSLSDELWNINHPRPHPVKQYHLLQWEEKDFYSYKIKGEWVLRQKRKTDSKLKKIVLGLNFSFILDKFDFKVTIAIMMLPNHVEHYITYHSHVPLQQ